MDVVYLKLYKETKDLTKIWEVELDRKKAIMIYSLLKAIKNGFIKVAIRRMDKKSSLKS